MRQLSEADKKLMALLACDGRASLTDLGKSLRVSHVAVGRRLSKLISEGYLRVQGLVGVKKLELKLVLALAEVESPQDMERLMESFEDCPRMILLATLLGGFNFVALMVAESPEVLESISSICCIRRAKGIRRTEIMVIGELVRPQHIPLKIPVERNYEKPPCKYVDCSICPRYLTNKCPGCPAIKGYRGPL